MCGFVGIFENYATDKGLRAQILQMSKKLRHRGPDWSGVFEDEHCIISHERLSIVDPLSGSQPLISADGQIILAVNGEIYNHQALRKQYPDYPFKTQSDCEVILPMYLAKGKAFLEDLNGIFAFALYDKRNNSYLIARDHMGIIPLYTGRDEQGRMLVASELKALLPSCSQVNTFPPGSLLQGPNGEVEKWYHTPWQDFEKVEKIENPATAIKAALTAAVERQLMCDVPYGVLLSGGLDSSLIAAIAKQLAPLRVESGNTESAWYPQLHSFAVGLEGAPDLAAARKVADYLGTVHHEIHFTIQQGLDALSDVVYHLETYDVTTIRASTPMFLMARFIKSMGIKMVLSGEGSDELFGGYLYFHKAPNAKAFHEETVRKLNKLHLYDCNRANKALAAWGVEGRVPFLDKEFIAVAMQVDPALKMSGNGKIEKHLLRSAFSGAIPDEILWRQKEQFSDGVGYSWIDALKTMTSNAITDEMMEKAAYRFPVQTPLQKEEYYYRQLFEQHFPGREAALTVPSVPSVACSTPEALAWDPAFANTNDPSGRAVKQVHQQAYGV